MKRIIILTGSEDRHEYFRKALANDSRFNVIASYCEGAEKSLHARTFADRNSSQLERNHVVARAQSEEDFFGEALRFIKDRSNAKRIRKGEINEPYIAEEIEALGPDILVCYGSSLIKAELLNRFKRKFLNVHLGLSPYYRGSGTNVWPLINREPHMVGATFMHIDDGIDTGNIIHQIRADIFLGDGPHTIGNRLIKKMTSVYSDLIPAFDFLHDETQPSSEGRLYLQKDFDSDACAALYENFRNGMIEGYLSSGKSDMNSYIVQNKALES